MSARSAIFSDLINPGFEEEFSRAGEKCLLPGWRQMLGTRAVRLQRPRRAKPPADDVFHVQETGAPSLKAIDEVPASPRHEAATEALASARALYGGGHHHVVYQKIA